MAAGGKRLAAGALGHTDGHAPAAMTARGRRGTAKGMQRTRVTSAEVAIPKRRGSC